MIAAEVVFISTSYISDIPCVFSSYPEYSWAGQCYARNSSIVGRFDL